MKGLLCLFALFVTLSNCEQENVGSNFNAFQDNINDKTPVPKRAALLLDRLMVALQRALDDYENTMSKDFSPSLINKANNGQKAQTFVGDMDDIMSNDLETNRPMLAGNEEDNKRINPKAVGLQRRGHGSTVHPKGRVWRCYFNAVTCF